ncbi:hypothetical protein [Pontixanthobacter sp.]|uniref:hypothetical protein n=1 Tax=Pontixanthobacter sp. TaxID=2792078 RepID=UPI003C7E13EE
MAALLHFVGFRDDRYWNAVRIWGHPDMIHMTWDIYAANDVAPDDLVIFANADWDRKPRSFTVEAANARTERKRGQVIDIP